MSWLKKIVASGFFYPLLSLILLSLVVWYGGPYFSFADYTPLADTDIRLAAIGVMMAGLVLAKLFKYVRAQWQQRKIVEQITQVDPLEQVISEEAKELSQKFELAFDLLKKSQAKINISDLPWYIIIGAPGSGKTTLLSNSGLRFPLAKEFSAIGGLPKRLYCSTRLGVILHKTASYKLTVQAGPIF